MTKIVVSVSSIIAISSVILTGCGDSSPTTTKVVSSSSSISTNSSSSIAAVTNQIKVSDAYVLSADVRIGGVLATLEVGNGVYEWSPAQEGIISVSKKGVNDLNDNGQVDSADAYAPAMSAPEGYVNVNPFTTLLDQNVSRDELFAKYPYSNRYTPIGFELFDYDVVLASESNLDIAKEVLKAVMYLASKDKALSKQRATCVPLPSLPSNIDANEKNYCDALTGESPVVIEEELSSLDKIYLSIDESNSTSQINSIAKKELDVIYGKVVVK